MAVPDQQSILLPLLQTLADGKAHDIDEYTDALARRFGLTRNELQEHSASGTPLFRNRVQWARLYLKEAGLVASAGHRLLKITDPGGQLLATNPTRIDHALLARIKEEARLGTTLQRGAAVPPVAAVTRERAAEVSENALSSPASNLAADKGATQPTARGQNDRIPGSPTSVDEELVTSVGIPDYQSLMLPLLSVVADGREYRRQEYATALAERLDLSAEERAQLLPSGSQYVFDNRVGWARTYLVKAGLLESTGRNRI